MSARYHKDILCRANSRKLVGRCIAGREILDRGVGSWIRPVSSRPSAEVNLDERGYQNGREPEIMDIIRIPMIRPLPQFHQQENHLIDDESYWTRQGSMSWSDLPGMTDPLADLWTIGRGRNDRVPQAETPGMANSLTLIRPSNVTVSVGAPGAAFGNMKRGVRACFRHRGRWYDLKVTDPLIEQTFRRREDGMYQIDRECYFCISLAAEPFQGDCYKLVATIITEEPL